MLKEFKEFIARGNVVDLAVGVIIGAAFGKIVTSVVNDLVMPPIGLLLGKVNFADMFLVLGQPADKPVPTSVAQAKALGIPTMNYGLFINTLIEFLIIAIVIFLVVKGINKIHKKEAPPVKTKDCPFCAEAIPLAATKCGHCASALATP